MDVLNKKTYLLFVVALLAVFVFDFYETNNITASSTEKTTNCILNQNFNTDKEYKTCFPAEGAKNNWQLYTYGPLYNKETLPHCAIDFYPIQEPSPGTYGDNYRQDRSIYKQKVYALWDGEIVNKTGTVGGCGLMIRLKSTQEQAGLTILDSRGEKIDKVDFYVEYCHFSKFSDFYSEGDTVKAGTYLGDMGASGGHEGFSNSSIYDYWSSGYGEKNKYGANNTGSHMHFRIRVNNINQSIFRQQSIPEIDVLRNIDMLQGVRVWDVDQWRKIATDNKNNHCNIYTVEPRAQKEKVFYEFLLDSPIIEGFYDFLFYNHRFFGIDF